MSVETWSARYPTVVADELQNLTLKETISIRNEVEPGAYIWTARLSTGLVGKHDCPSGNSSYAPKGRNELIVLVGKLGIETAVDFGFIPCSYCHPEDRPNFWDDAKDAIEWNYPELADIHQFADKAVVPYDVRRVNWEALSPYLTAAPTTLPANVTIITRSDGSMQFAYKGTPLYYYSGDTKAGDTNGDGFNGIWHIVTP